MNVANSSLGRGSGTSIPDPDEDVTELEDRWINQHGIQAKTRESQLESKMAVLSISDGALPLRPAFGTAGSEVRLWANYFRMNPKVKTLYRYDLRVTETKVTKKEDDAARERAKAKGKGKPDESNPKEAKEAKGKKLEKVIKLVLNRLGTVDYATEYKQQLVTRQKLQLPPESIYQIDLEEPGRRPETWFVRFDGPNTVDISSLMGYLGTLEDPANDATFPKFPAEIDALGVVLGHTARTNPNTVAIGRNRFFAIDKDRKDRAPGMPDDTLKEVMRGYVQSVRPATGRLLLNTNVTHGVFKKEFPLDELFRWSWVANLHEIEPLGMQQQQPALKRLGTLHKFLARSRVRCRMPGDKPGEFITIERTAAGLATTEDGRGETRRPDFRYPRFRFSTPASVKFYLGKPKTPAAVPPSGLQFDTMVTVSNYYRASKCSSSLLPDHHCMTLTIPGYNITAKPGLPLINVGTTNKPIYILAELCTLLPGQPWKTKLASQEQKAMVNFACRSPAENARSITTRARDMLALDNNRLLVSSKDASAYLYCTSMRSDKSAAKLQHHSRSGTYHGQGPGA